MRLVPEGWPFVLMGAAVTAVLGLTGFFQGSPAGASGRSLLFWAAGLTGFLTLFTLYFFRNPTPTTPQGEDLVLAPAEGRVVQITSVEEPEFLQGPATRISIFLSIFNVHVQRAPISGRVAYRDYNPGKYLAAWNPKASEENEQAALGIQAGERQVLVRQIAGLVARRVVTDPMEGDSVIRGRRIGIIRFGSRVDLFLPPAWEVTCEEGDKVKVGQTVVARIPAKETRGEG